MHLKRLHQLKLLLKQHQQQAILFKQRLLKKVLLAQVSLWSATKLARSKAIVTNRDREYYSFKIRTHMSVFFLHSAKLIKKSRPVKQGDFVESQLTADCFISRSAFQEFHSFAGASQMGLREVQRLRARYLESAD